MSGSSPRRGNPVTWIHVAVLATLAGVFALAAMRAVRPSGTHGTASASNPIRTALPDDYPRGAAPVPDFELLDQTGATFTAARLRGSPTIVVFAFAHCQAICPGLVRDVREAAKQAGPDVQLVLITLDPVRDTPLSLPQTADDWRLGSDEWLLSGDPVRVESVLDAFQVPRERDPATDTLVHPALVVVLDDQGRQAYRLNAAPVAWIAEAVRRSRLAD